jgi:hypothetical protein
VLSRLPHAASLRRLKGVVVLYVFVHVPNVAAVRAVSGAALFWLPSVSTPCRVWGSMLGVGGSGK